MSKIYRMSKSVTYFFNVKADSEEAALDWCKNHDFEDMTKKTEIFGNIGYVNSVRKDSYGFFGTDVPCVLLTDEYEPHGSEDRE